MSKKKDKFYYKDGTTSDRWYRSKILHRTDGPALECADGYKRWWVDGEEYTKKQFNKLIKEINEMNLSMRLTDPREWVRELGENEVKLVSSMRYLD